MRAAFALATGLALAAPVSAADEYAAAFAKLKRGDYDAVETFLEPPEPGIAFLLKKTRSGPRARATALEILTRVDLADDGVVNRPEVIAALADAVALDVENPTVVDEGLRGLARAEGASPPAGLVTALQARADAGSVRAIQALGVVGDDAAIAALAPHLQASDPARVEWARCAMAKLGDPESLAAVVADLAAPGPQRNRTFERLAYIRDPSTTAAVAAFLADPGAPVSPDRDVGHAPYRFMAAWALGQIVPDPPRQVDVGAVQEADVIAWRAWWAEHASEFPRAEP